MDRLLALSVLPAGELVALHAIANDALLGEQLPTRIKLLNWGDNETVSKGKVKVGLRTMAALAANQERYGFDQVALDYNHNSLPSHPNFQADPRKVAAFGKPEVIENDGLYLTGLSYTPSGQEHAREYRDLSPTPLLDESGEVVFLHSAALCPQGEVKGLSFYSAAFLTAKSHAMPPLKQHLIALSALAVIGQLTGLKALSAESTDAEVEAFAKALGEKAPGLQVAKEELKPTGFEALSAEITEMKKLFAAQAEDGQRRGILDQALREGKVVPLAASKLPFADFAELVKQLPAGQVPLDQRTPEGLTALAATGLGGNPEEASILKNLGLTKEKLLK